MKILIYEPTGGFWPYTPDLVDGLIKTDFSKHIYFLTSETRKDEYKTNSHFVTFLPIANEMKKDINRKNVLLWCFDRFRTVNQWCRIRNKAIKEYLPDILHIQSTASLVDHFYLSSMKNRTKIVMTVHDVLPITNSKANKSKKALKKVYDLADEIIVHSQSNKKSLIKNFSVREDKIIIIPHGAYPVIDSCNRLKSIETLKLEPSTKYVLIFGSLRKSKGIDLGIKSFYHLKKKYSNVKLIIAGSMNSDTDIEYLKNLCKDLKLEDEVIWETKFIPDGLVPHFFNVSTITLLPYTKFFSQSGVLFQAYRYGVPIVCTNVGSLGETVNEDNTGIVVDSFSDQDLGDAMYKVLSDDKLHATLSQNQNRLIEEKYHWEKIAERTESVYRRIGGR